MSSEKELAQTILNLMFDKIDYEKFLDVFNDKYNWFAFLGVSEEDYQDLSSKVYLEREKKDVPVKKKVLTR